MLVPGPYTMEFRVQFLEKLLSAQNQIRRDGPDPAISLILDEEIHEIQKIWRMEQGDWRNTAYDIYERVTGRRLDAAQDDAGGFGGMEQRILEDACSQTGVPAQLVSRLLNTEHSHQGMTRHSRIFPEINRILSEEWRESLDEIVEDLQKGRLDCHRAQRRGRVVLIKQVTLTDCGAYAGRHAFDFAADGDKPIILVGGQNGGGKTTIFESVLLCLYGMRYVKATTTRKAYERRLSRMIHRAPDRWPGRGREVVVGLDGVPPAPRGRHHRIQGRAQVARLKGRRQRRDGDLDARPAGATDAEYAHPDAMEPDQWQSFVNGLVPRGIAALFFFDGEMVAQMADGGESAAIRSSFNSLLGLDLVDQLQADMRTNLVRNLSGDDRHLRDELAKLTSQKIEAESKAGSLRESRVRKEAELSRVRAGMEDTEARVERLGGGFAEKRQDLKSRLASKRTELEMTGKMMAELCGAELPLGLVPDELQEVQRQMGADGESARAAVERETIARTISGDQVGYPIRCVPEGPAPQKGGRISGIITIMDGALPRASQDARAEVFGFSTPQREAISRMIRNAGGPL